MATASSANDCHTDKMFGLARPGPTDVEAAIDSVRDQAENGPRFLSTHTGVTPLNLPAGFAHDKLRTRLGAGDAAFAAAREAFTHWAQFDLGWTRVANPGTPLANGQVVAVEVHAVGLWSLNLSRVVEMVESAHCFGFLYSTTRHHAEEGEEIFRLELDSADGSVWYHLEAVSRPRHVLPRLVYPLTRALQHRFARDSHRRMRAVPVEL